MAINKAPMMQRGMRLSEFMPGYGSEAWCEEALAGSFSLSGLMCCHRQASTFRRAARRARNAAPVAKHTSLTAGTMLQGTPWILTRRFLGIYLMTQSKNQIAALAMMRHKPAASDGPRDEATVCSGRASLR